MNLKKHTLPLLKKESRNRSLMSKSLVFGGLLGATLGALFGAALGALTATLNGVLIGLFLGLVPGTLAGALTAALTVKIAGTTGVGYFAGMIFGALFGMILGTLIPASVWADVYRSGLPFVEGLMVSRFETVIHISFLFSILATIVGVWVAGRNLIPGTSNTVKDISIDQFDLVQVIEVPEEYLGIIEIDDIGVVIEIDDNQSFEVECIRPDGSYKWLAILNRRYIRLKHKIPDNM
jgi:hypothetical protein